MGSLDYNYGENNNLGASYSFENLNGTLDKQNYTSKPDTTTMLNVEENDRYTVHQAQIYNESELGNTNLSAVYNFYYRSNDLQNHYHDLSIKQGDKDVYNLHNLNVDLNTSFGENLTLKYGLKGSHLIEHIDYEFDTIFNKLQYKEQIGAAYFTVENIINDFDLDFGLRYEMSQSSLEDSSHTSHDWFPFLYFAYYFDDNSLYLNYTRSIVRPPFMNLQANPLYFSPRSWTIGNPNLVAAFSNNFEVGVSTRMLEAKIYGTYDTYGIFTYTYSDDNENAITTYDNLKNEINAGVNISCMLPPLSFAQLSITFNSYYDRTQYKDNRHTTSWNNFLNGSLNLRFDEQGIWTASVTYWHLFPQEKAGMKWKNRANLTCRVNCNLFDNSLKISLQANDIFNQDIARYTYTYMDPVIDHYNTFDRRSLTFSLNYMIGNGKKVKKNKEVQLEDINRIPVIGD